ncbi:MAG: tRNA uridine-5-carboxymethylaminomethyl(34) synthesis enzyme MnmG [Phycisphaeraceae bacterium]
MQRRDFDIIVIGSGHAGAEAAWAAANMLLSEFDAGQGGGIALITMDPRKIGAMSCNPCIGGLAKGQMVREIDALGGLMGLAADATGIQFRMLNASKGPAVRGPRCQSDKYAYAAEVQRLLRTRSNLTILAGTVERFITDEGRVVSLLYKGDADYDAPRQTGDCCGEFSAISLAEKPIAITCRAVVLTTGTFMRALMHTGESKTEGGRVGEGTAVSISGALRDMGFELGRLKTGTPPRLAAETIDFDSLQLQPGDDEPVPFSDMSASNPPTGVGGLSPVLERFPVLEQRPCHITHTNAAIHDAIRANLDRAPMYNGQIETQGPRYCPSIEDKVVRFADKTSHHVFLEPESLTTNEIYCNGISTSLPADVQETIVRNLPGCENAKILRHGYAVEYDMVWPHQIDATCMTKLVEGLFLAGQINGTSGYEEAAGQGLVAGINAVRYLRGETLLRLRRDQAYIGVLLDDLVTKTPREPYRMFTSRAEHRLLLRGDNTDERLTPLGRELGTVDDARWSVFQDRLAAITALRDCLSRSKIGGVRTLDWVRRPDVDASALLARLNGESLPSLARAKRILSRVIADVQYAGYIERERRLIEKLGSQEEVPLPSAFDYQRITGLRKEAKNVLSKFKPTTMGQASRLAGVTPADIMLLTVAIGR